ncbi:hypothetical protein GCM10010218_36080 [Streptomyces mashuensis]|uniref:Uncharacterized protein n=1 Tax=Streptomyces mashuensis TaxID=33904 RepID=A0A919EDV3_9ACTN|nr:hypothetical protein [Streptomyces mashuensis]GHF51317.1 hypothetical protein GCM10010218_36080 [Streptomyces mashuensis]
MSATDHSRPAGALLLCRAEPGRVRPSAQLLREPLLLAPAGEGWSVLVPGEESWQAEGTSPAAVTAEWAHALTTAEPWPAVGLWWDDRGAGFVVASGFRRTAGYTWLADGTPRGEETALAALRSRLGLDPVLDAAAFDRLAEADPDADAAARIRGLIAVLARAGLHLPPGLAPGTSTAALRTAVGTAPGVRAVEWPGWREAVCAGPRARALSAAEIAVGAGLLLAGRRRARRGLAVAGAVLVADGVLTLAYDRWRARGE